MVHCVCLFTQLLRLFEGGGFSLLVAEPIQTARYEMYLRGNGGQFAHNGPKRTN